ncbi:DUF6708 domain-containing protein [Halomonas sp. A29]|uniref:DUF6708 domain-containing protein n=1 Tax=Halomonas sp. A29 TaxID=3102786 RepID=UPI00398B015A
MLTGWTKPFKLDRPLEREERYAELPKQRQPGIIPDSFGSLISFNSTYAEFIDRRDRLRGMAYTTFGGLLALLIFLGGLFFVVYSIYDLLRGHEVVANGVFAAVMSVLVFGFTWFAWRRHFSKDLFTYTHYPIRFNRKDRKVYVFRHNGPGGVLTVPWDEVFWHVGRGMEQKFLCDIRGHVLKGSRIKDTFAVGHYFDDSRMDRIQAMWEFIRRYMEEGPETVAEHPLDRQIDKSVTPSWTNCYIHAYAHMGPGFIALRFVLFPLFYTIVGLLTLGRWLTLNSCKTPVWPPEVEAECQVEPNDPHRWEEPSYQGEFANRPGSLERQLERMRLQGGGRR